MTSAGMLLLVLVIGVVIFALLRTRGGSSFQHGDDRHDHAELRQT